MEIVENNIRLTEYETIVHIEECSSRIQNRVSIKINYPRSFMVQIMIG